jgi:Rrf2 family protein
MRFSRQIYYAVSGVFDLAYNGQGDPVQVRVIGERQGIPIRYLEQIFQRLRRAELVTGKRGPGGGYVLAREPSEISLREIIEAVEGPLGDAQAPTIPAHEASNSETVSYRPDFLWPQLSEGIGQLLAETSLDQICRRAAQQAVPRSSSETINWVI